jgi:hypothetical protein
MSRYIYISEEYYGSEGVRRFQTNEISKPRREEENVPIIHDPISSCVVSKTKTMNVMINNYYL